MTYNINHTEQQQRQSLRVGGPDQPATPMDLDLQQLRKNLCTSLCAEVKVVPRSDHRISISTPFTFSDGDHLVLLAEVKLVRVETWEK